MTAFAVMEMYRRLRASHWPTVALPWVRWGVQMVDVGDDLVALERDQYGKVKTVVVWPQYRWDPARETLPGGELFDMLKRRDDAELAKLGAAQVQVSDDDRKKYPILVDHLTQRKWEDGSKRETSKLSVWHDGGVFKIMLRDVASGLVIFVASPSLSKILPTLESVLASPDADWRADQLDQWKGKRKK